MLRLHGVGDQLLHRLRRSRCYELGRLALLAAINACHGNIATRASISDGNDVPRASISDGNDVTGCYHHVVNGRDDCNDVTRVSISMMSTKLPT